MTTLRWHDGTAYDFFISLLALHHAGEFGLRPSWAAGVRQRLSPARREFLERFHTYAMIPLNWIECLPVPRDSETALACLADLEPAERLMAVALPDELPAEMLEALAEIRTHGNWTSGQKELVGRCLGRRNKYLRAAGLDHLLQDWAAAGRTGDVLLAALGEYYQVFFAEEEDRLRPVLAAGLAHAQARAEDLPLQELVEELSQGVRFEDWGSVRELTLAPSYWSSPFIFSGRGGSPNSVIVFGCRPKAESLVPGAEAPDSLVSALKSLADPTRLRILRYLSGEPQAPSELARRLRLRPPTVIHHLQALRLAGLVTIHIGEDGERRYAARLETLGGIFTSVEEFIREPD
jgi:DNA-binding transcriptional ArsR family regulator